MIVFCDEFKTAIDKLCIFTALNQNIYHHLLLKYELWNYNTKAFIELLKVSQKLHYSLDTHHCFKIYKNKTVQNVYLANVNTLPPSHKMILDH